MNRVNKLRMPPSFLAYSSVGGYEEKRGPLGDAFDLCDESDSFGQKTWELSEGEMGRCALNIALSKMHLSHSDLDLIAAGDLQNQCVASALGLESFGAPFLGVYGACSTCTESLIILSGMINSGTARTAASVTTSHNSAAERQFRTPLEYGAQRSPTAQWTSTASGAFILTSDEELLRSKRMPCAKITEFTVGRIVDGATSDASNMGAAMAFAAADTICEYFAQGDARPHDLDLIVTGDLGSVGSDILRDILDKKLPASSGRHADCGMMLYDMKSKDVHAGASGCGTSASVLASYFLPRLEDGTLRDILFLSTGALMSPSSVLQGNSIKGIAHLIRITADC